VFLEEKNKQKQNITGVHFEMKQWHGNT